MLLVLVGLVSRLLINTFFKNLGEDVFLDSLGSLLVDELFFVSSLVSLAESLLLMLLDLGMTLLFHVVDLFEFLLLLAFIIVLLIHVACLALRNQLVSVIFLWLSKDLSFLKMIVNHHRIKFHIENGLFDLNLSWHGFVKLKLLSHFLDFKDLFEVVILNYEILTGVDYFGVVSISDASVDELVFSPLELFEGFGLDLLLSVDEAVLVSVMVEVDLAVSVVDLDHLFPVVGLFGLLVVLDCFEFVWESSS